MTAAPLWDVDLRCRFAQAGRSFELSVRFTSNARRLVLFGPSGAGKSQTLRIVAGLTTPDAGHVRMAGRTLLDVARGAGLPARQRQLGYVFQDYALFPHLTLAQNLAFGLGTGPLNPRRGSAAEHPQVLRWLQAFELDALAGQYPDQLSGGQRQRAALARALVPEPRALLLDEPFAALDRTLRVRLCEELVAVQARLDIPMILIVHDEADAHRLADEVILMEEGQVRSCLPAQAFIDRGQEKRA